MIMRLFWSVLTGVMLGVAVVGFQQWWLRRSGTTMPRWAKVCSVLALLVGCLCLYFAIKSMMYMATPTPPSLALPVPPAPPTVPSTPSPFDLTPPPSAPPSPPFTPAPPLAKPPSDLPPTQPQAPLAPPAPPVAPPARVKATPADNLQSALVKGLIEERKESDARAMVLLEAGIASSKTQQVVAFELLRGAAGRLDAEAVRTGFATSNLLALQASMFDRQSRVAGKVATANGLMEGLVEARKAMLAQKAGMTVVTNIINLNPHITVQPASVILPQQPAPPAYNPPALPAVPAPLTLPSLSGGSTSVVPRQSAPPPSISGFEHGVYAITNLHTRQLSKGLAEVPVVGGLFNNKPHYGGKIVKRQFRLLVTASTENDIDLAREALRDFTEKDKETKLRDNNDIVDPGNQDQQARLQKLFLESLVGKWAKVKSMDPKLTMVALTVIP